MQRDYSHFKPSTLTPEAYLYVVQNAIAFFRHNGQQTPHYDSATLFQAVALFERITLLQERAQCEIPLRTLTDEELYSTEFAIRLEFFTDEFKAAEKGTLALMTSVLSTIPNSVLLASCFLNTLSSQPEKLHMNKIQARSDVCLRVLPVYITYMGNTWTQETYDNLMDWYPPALLLCKNDNIPPMCAPIVHVSLELVMSLYENPMRRFNTMRDTFSSMINPCLKEEPYFALPNSFLIT